MKMDWTLYREREPSMAERIMLAIGLDVDLEETLEVTIVVDHALRVPGSFAFNAASDVDYYGFEELDWHCEIDGEEASKAVEDWASEDADAITEALWDRINEDAADNFIEPEPYDYDDFYP